MRAVSPALCALLLHFLVGCGERALPAPAVNSREFLPQQPPAVRWVFRTGGVVGASPVIADGTVFFGSWDEHMYGVDALTGTLRWSHHLEGGTAAPPLYTPTALICASLGGALLGLSPETGEELWRLPLPEGAPGFPTISGGVIYIGGESGLLAIDTAGGTVLWSFGTGGPVTAAPAVHSGTVYAACHDGAVRAHDASSGRIRWVFQTRAPVLSGPAVGDGDVFFGSSDSCVYSLETGTGDLNWVFETMGPVTASPVLSEDLVLVGSVDNRMYAIDRESGEEVWRYATDGWIWSAPAVVGGTAVFGSYDGCLYAVNIQTGREAWSLHTEEMIHSTPAAAPGILCFGSLDGGLYALEMPTP